MKRKIKIIFPWVGHEDSIISVLSFTKKMGAYRGEMEKFGLELLLFFKKENTIPLKETHGIIV